MMNFWEIYSSHWHGQSTPLRPTSLDLNLYEQFFNEAILNQSHHNLLILGVTPELYKLGKALKLYVRGYDESKAMIQTVWPGPPQDVVTENWLDIAKVLKDKSIVVCDGGFHLLKFEEQHNFIQTLQSESLIQSCFIFRFFLPVINKFNSSQILKKFEQKEIPTINYLKFHLWNAEDINKNNTIQLKNVWDTVMQRADGDVVKYFKKYGFSDEEILTFKLYEDNSTIYYFRTIDEINSLFLDTRNFRKAKIAYPSYPEGQYFPIIYYQ